MPIVRFGGVVQDGRAREELLRARGIAPIYRDCRTRTELVAVLFAVSPDLALHEAGKVSIGELAELCQVSPSMLATLRRRARGLPPPSVRVPRFQDAIKGGRQIQIRFWGTWQLRHLLSLGAERNKRSMADYIKTTMLEQIRKDVPLRVRQAMERGRLAGSNHRDSRKSVR